MNNIKKILIIGAGEAGRMLLSEYKKRSKDNSIVGFADDDKDKIGYLIDGKKVLCTTDEIKKILKETSTTDVIIAMPSVKNNVIQKIINDVSYIDHKINIHILPSVEKFFDTVPLSPSLLDFPFADIFDRDEFDIDIEIIEKAFAGKKILVTGAGGSIGSEICKQLLKFNVSQILAIGKGEHSIYELIKALNEYTELMDNDPEVIYKIVDIKDFKLLKKVFDEYKPDIVFHAAAHKHVPLMEFNEIEAIQNNIVGTKNVLEVSADNSVEEFVFISTDKAVRPFNIMGTTKRIAELLTIKYFRERGLKTSIVRFGNVTGSRGSVIPLFVEQILKGGPVTITHPEVKRFFMSIPEAALLVLNASAFSSGGEIFVLDMGEQYLLSDVAKRIIRYFGCVPDKDILIEYTGLRPGEKLYEELFYDDSKLVKTDNNKISILNSKEVSIQGDSLDDFCIAVPDGLYSLTSLEIRNKLKKIVPEYVFSESNVKSALNKKLVN